MDKTSLENRIQAALTDNRWPVCPHCGDIDNEDEHEVVDVVDAAEAAMVVQCVCGEGYLAQARKITVWTTRKLSGQ